jgi:hypothetical protein
LRRGGSVSSKRTKPASIGTAFVTSVAMPAAVGTLPCWNAAWSTLVPARVVTTSWDQRHQPDAARDGEPRGDVWAPQRLSLANRTYGVVRGLGSKSGELASMNLPLLTFRVDIGDRRAIPSPP